MMTCQNCKTDFVITPDAEILYQKLKVPPPTWCPWCRMLRRMNWRNERSLYKRLCDFSKEPIITPFHPDAPMKVYQKDIWWGDAWDPLEYGRDYDFTKPFFEQFAELMRSVPLPSIFNGRCVGSDYCNHCGELKNCYLVFASWEGENVMFASQTKDCKDTLDNLGSGRCELCYEVISSEKCYNLIFGKDCESCDNSAFLYNSKGCSYCFACVNLRNKKYHIFNKPYTKEEYLEKIKEYNLKTHSGFEKAKRDFMEFLLAQPRRYANIINGINSTGDNLLNVKNCAWCFDGEGGIENVSYSINILGPFSDSSDVYGAGVKSDLLYEVVDSGDQGSRLFSTIFTWGSNDISYGYGVHGSKNCFGCVSIRSKEYCILNKLYSKEEYGALVPKIIEHMKQMPYQGKHGRQYSYGDFFPLEISPFAYNETIAQEYDPRTKEEAISRGYAWRDEVTRDYKPTKKSVDLPDSIDDVTEEITKEIIECEHRGECKEKCTTALKITKEELRYYKKFGVPLPRLCPNCRHFARLARRNPPKLYPRSCMCNLQIHNHDDNQCKNKFETTYAPDRLEIIYCESCYNAEIA